MKTCSKCKVEKPETEFYAGKRYKDGLRSYCKKCGIANAAAWFRANSSAVRAYDARRRNTKQGYIDHKYRGMRQRVTGRDKPRAHLYKGLGLMSREEFLEWALSDLTFNRLWDEWQRLGKPHTHTPSIDRIDTQRGYVPGNVQFLAAGEHSKKTNDWRHHGINPITLAV